MVSVTSSPRCLLRSQGSRYCFFAVWVHQILGIRLQDEARLNRERVIPFKRHLEVLNADEKFR